MQEIYNLSSGNDEWIYQKDLRILQELIVILNHIMLYSNDHAIKEKINFIKKTDSETLNKVFLSPEGRQYITLCYLAIKFKDKNDIVSNYCKWIGIPAEDILTYLIKRLDLFIISIKILNNKINDLNCLFELSSIGILPGTYIGWNVYDENNLFVDYNNNNDELVLYKKNGSEIIEFDSFKINNLNSAYFFEIQHSKKYAISIDVYTQAALIDFNGREQLPRLSNTRHKKIKGDNKDLNDQLFIIEKALDYIALAEPSLIKYFKEINHSFVPLIPPQGALPSSSNSSIDNMYWYSASNNPLLVAEMIIHEYSHQKLFRLQDIDPLIDREKHGSGWDNCTIYSPWRDDPRPINGVFHGLVVFSEASNFWLKLINNGGISQEEENIALRRFAMLASQLEYACKSLSNTHFTKLGKNIFNYYESTINNVFIKKIIDERLYDLEPFFMEYHDEIIDNSKITIKEIVDSHRISWVKKYQNLI